MRSSLGSCLLWGIVLAEVFGVVGVISSEALGVSWRRSIADILFLEGAVLLVAGGLIDMGRSVTFAHIRAVLGLRISDPPAPVQGPGRNYILLIAGLLLCLQGALAVYLLPAGGSAIGM